MFPCIPLSVIFLAFGSTPSVARSHIQFNDPQPSLAPRANNVNVNPNGSTFLWLPEDTYSGQNFFDRFSFFNYSDPTHGQVNFVDAQTAFSKSLAYVQSDGTVIIKGDDTSTLPLGAFRDSVRIQSQTQYNTGLFILDLNRAPWGCGTWPAFWTIGGGQWPYGGEIDIIEGVHDNEHNQVAWHTGPGCMLTPNANFTGTIVSNNTNNLNCDGLVNGNSGCGITDWSRASYGPYFDAQGGGVFAMKWDEIDISVWSFYRAAIPPDITQGSPNPANWGVPSAVLQSNNCDLLSFFKNHSIVFDITFCGDWAGNSYATSGCPGTCADHLMDPNNFVNASWSINSLKVYRKQLINGQISNAVTDRAAWDPRALLLLVLTIPFMIYMH